MKNLIRKWKNIKRNKGKYISNKKKDWISPSNTRNYIIGNTLSDWLKYKNSKKKQLIRHTNNKPNTFLQQKGNEFESYIKNYLQTKFKSKFIEIGNIIDDKHTDKTISEIKKGTPIIYSAPFKNYNNMTFGIIDLLIRSDYINKIVDIPVLNNNEIYKKSLKLNKNYFYIIVDIKFSTLYLQKNNINLSNQSKYKFYRIQTYIYNKFINDLQGYYYNSAFILGRKCKNKNLTTKHIFEKIGKIEFNEEDETLLKKSINWIKDVKYNSHKWSVNPPSRIELFPNMNLKFYDTFSNIKNKISNDIGEITNIWYCSVKHRDIALKKGVTSWKDERCTSSLLEIKGKKSIIIDNILNINRQTTDIIRPNIIKNRKYNWRSGRNEIFVDFETTTNFDIINPISYLFMIGIYWNNGRTWQYKKFICKTLNDIEQYNIMKQFISFAKSYKIWYWYADKNIWLQYVKKYPDLLSIHLNWCDLYKIFTEEPIVLKNCFNYSLKNISKILYENKLISSHIKSSCKTGFDALINAYNAYNTNNHKILDDIALYNKFDCEVLYEILTYLRNNH